MLLIAQLSLYHYYSIFHNYYKYSDEHTDEQQEINRLADDSLHTTKCYNCSEKVQGLNTFNRISKYMYQLSVIAK